MYLNEFILGATFLAILWYSYETRGLKNWQKKLAQLTYLSVHTDVLYHSERAGNNKGTIIKEMANIFDNGKLDIRKLYAKGVIPDKK